MPEKVPSFSLEDQEIFSKSKFKDSGRCESSFFLKKKRNSQKWRLILQNSVLLFYLRALDCLVASFFSFTYSSNHRFLLRFQKFLGLQFYPLYIPLVICITSFYIRERVFLRAGIFFIYPNPCWGPWVSQFQVRSSRNFKISAVYPISAIYPQI